MYLRLAENLQREYAAFQISSLLFIYVYILEKKKRRKRLPHNISLLSEPRHVASRNQIRKYATGAVVTGNIQLYLRAYWPPLEFPRMSRIRFPVSFYLHTHRRNLSSVCTTSPPARASPREIFSAEFPSADRKLFRATLSRVINILLADK